MAQGTSFTSSMTEDGLVSYVERLLDHYVPDGQAIAGSLRAAVHDGLRRIEYCFTHIHRKYYNQNDAVTFDHLNSDHMAALLYFIGNSAWKLTGETTLPTKLFYLNKVMHGLDLYFSVALPDIFLLVHPVGSVIGNAEYRNYFAIYQNCTVGSDAGIYPRFGEGVILYSRTSVLGDCDVGSNVVFAANSFIVNTAVEANSVVVGQYPQHRRLTSTLTARERLFGVSPS